MARIRLLFVLNGIAIAAFGPFASVILADRGFETAQIGLLSALVSVAFVLSISAWGHLGDVVLGRARALRLAVLGAAALLALFMLPLPLAAVGVLYVAYAACNGAVGPLSDALAVNAMRDPGRQYGKVRALASASFTVAAVAFGLLYGRAGYWPSGVLFVGVAIAIAVNAGGVPDLGRAKLTSHRRGGAVREVLAIQPALPRVLAAVGLAHVGVFAGFTFLSLRIVELGGGPPEVALSSAVAAAAEVGAMIVASRLVPRIGLRTLFTVSSLLYTLAFVLWAVLASPVAIIASRLISGAGYSGLWIASVMAMQTLLPPRLQGSGQALISMTTVGLAAFTANVVGGLLYASSGPEVLFGISALFGVAGALVGWLVFPHRGARRYIEPAPPEPALARAPA
jgi:PPP family 3-phenylpropionic acid transporter